MNSYTLLSCIDSKVEHSTKFYGRFELGPFAPGQALTVANALRRSLLSQLSGSAITLLEIKGASNEYEILNGIRESVLDIILNIKQIVLTSDFELFSPQVGFLNVKGPGIVRARDLKLPAFLYAVDPNQYIATLNTKGHLHMKYLICCGKNYITYTPNDEQYFEWVNLFEKATALSPCSRTPRGVQLFPCTFSARQEPKVLKKSGFLTAFHSRFVSEKISFSLNSKKTLGLSSNNKNQETIFAFSKKKVPCQITNFFYKQWINERSFFKTQSIFSNDLNKNYDFLKKKKKKLMDGYKATNFQKPSPEKMLSESKNQFHDSEEINEKGKIKNSFKTLKPFKILAPKVTNYKTGYFPIDAIFMPVNRVNYLIESDDSFKVAKDRIILEVWTNGSIHPRHAIHKAAKALIQLFLPLQQMRTTLFQKPAKFFDSHGANILAKPSSTIKKKKRVEKKIKKSTPDALNNQAFDTRILDLDIGNLELKTRPYSSLKKANINTIQDLLSYSKKDLLDIKNFELRSLVEVEKALTFLNLTLK